MKRIGLVFTGGGGKGAYQIGVWKALKEFGVDKSISAISGTSVGALNAALFVQGDYKKAEELWLNISHDQILTINHDLILNRITNSLGFRLENIIKPYINKLVGHGWFTRDGLRSLIKKNIDLSGVSNSDIPFFATCFKAQDLSAKYFEINHLEPETIIKVLLASSALPFIFDSEVIDGVGYFDGGIPLPKADNIPIKPLYDIGCDLIIVVHLKRTDIINHHQFNKAKIIEIFPSEYQGGLFKGTLDFSSTGSNLRINQGYNDTLEILRPIYEMGVTQEKITRTLSFLRDSEQQYKSTREDLLKQRNMIKEEIIIQEMSYGNKTKFIPK